MEGALLLVRFTLRGKLCAHCSKFRFQRFDLAVLLGEQALLLLDLGLVNDDFLFRDRVLVKLPFLVVAAVAVVDPLDKLKQGAQGQHRVTLRHGARCMHGEIA